MWGCEGDAWGDSPASPRNLSLNSDCACTLAWKQRETEKDGFLLRKYIIAINVFGFPSTELLKTTSSVPEVLSFLHTSVC